MCIEREFLGPHADALFSSVAAFTDAHELQALDVAEGQRNARMSIDRAIDNALQRKKNPGSRIALIRGDSGSGKSHVLTMMFKRVASRPLGEVYPAVLQLTAPVDKADYEGWLVDAVVRELSARHFANEDNESPLRRLAGRLLARMPVADQDEYLRLIDDLENDGEIHLAFRFAQRLRREAAVLLSETPPTEAFLAVVLLAGFGDSSALNYLRYGIIDSRIKDLGLREITKAHERIDVIRNLALSAQIGGASLVFGFDQVENTAQFGSEALFVHAVTQAVRIVEASENISVILVVLSDVYENIVSGSDKFVGLARSDRDRIEREVPTSAHLDSASPDFLVKVIVQRLAVLRERAGLPPASDSLDPLPTWMVPRVQKVLRVRAALREVAQFREKWIELGRRPKESDLEKIRCPPKSCKRDLDKEWMDCLDTAPAAINKLLDTTKAELLVWWLGEASREHASSEPAQVALSTLDDAFKTPLIDIVLTENRVPIETRQLGLCEAPNRNHQLANQIEAVLAAATRGTPAVLRTNPFPKGRQTQVSGPLRQLETLSGLKLDLSETEWHKLLRAKDFFDKTQDADDFLAWRRDRQWLLTLMSPLQPLIEPPAKIRVLDTDEIEDPPSVGQDRDQDPARKAAETPSGSTGETSPQDHSAFPVLIGNAEDGTDVFWAPYREPPHHLNNFSVLVTGDAGSGKTQTIRVLIDAACRKGVPVTLFDFKADYGDEAFAGPLGIEVIDVRSRGVPFNPMQPPPRGASGAQPIEHAYEMSSVLARVFKLGAIQQGQLREAVADVYKKAGIDPREWVDPASRPWPSFALVLDRLKAQTGTAALVTKLAPLCDLGLFRAAAEPGVSFETFINKRICLDLSELSTDEIKAAVAEIIIIQLHGYALRGDQPRRLARLLVFDEAHRVKNSQRLESLAREGRAFGVGIVIGTQFPGDISETMAGNLATQLFLMNNQANHRKFVVTQLLGSTSTREGREMLDKIGNLKPFEGVFMNAHHSRGVFLTILPHFRRVRST